MQPQKALLSEAGFAADSLSTPGETLAAFFRRVTIATPSVETVERSESRGRILASRVVAEDDYPASARSSMDGFAIAAGGAPGTFDIVASIRMGESPSVPVSAAQAARIATGGVLPPGTDAVVPVESCRVRGDFTTVEQPVTVGENVVPCGADMCAGEAVLAAGIAIGPAQIGLLASLGIEHVDVYRRPLVGIVSSGDEIVPPSQRPMPGQVRDSNRYAIGAALEAMGARIEHYPTVDDAEDSLANVLREMLDECDAVVANGGSSVGVHDRLPDAVARFEPGVIVHGLRIKPGKPALFGASGMKPIVGLPGNPASALFVLEAVAAPIFFALAGAPHHPVTERLRLSAAVRGRPGWTSYVPVEIEDGSARPLEMRSFSVRLAARAGGYLVASPDAYELRAGDEVTVHRFLT
ncbi:MAG TPA: molybdopterin molybdotransferase MoeA [Candidatus Tumulicola sp.]